jgi:uncharacterized protein YdhG (YjbR/CyaY superfamily)
MSRRNDAETTGAGSEVDDYLAAVPEHPRAALQKLRETIRAAAPKATERIGYGIPMFYQQGPLVGLGASKNHCSFYVMSPAVMDSHEAELTSYDTSKGTIRFPADSPPSAALVRKLVNARIEENDRKA